MHLSYVLSAGSGEPTCPENYVLNPVASTCIRLALSGYSWHGAKANCEAQGEKLAVFTTEESVEWISNYVKNRAPSGTCKCI